MWKLYVKVTFGDIELGCVSLVVITGTTIPYQHIKSLQPVLRSDASRVKTDKNKSGIHLQKSFKDLTTWQWNMESAAAMAAGLHAPSKYMIYNGEHSWILNEVFNHN